MAAHHDMRRRMQQSTDRTSKSRSVPQATSANNTRNYYDRAQGLPVVQWLRAPFPVLEPEYEPVSFALVHEPISKRCIRGWGPAFRPGVRRWRRFQPDLIRPWCSEGTLLQLNNLPFIPTIISVSWDLSSYGSFVNPQKDLLYRGVVCKCFGVGSGDLCRFSFLLTLVTCSLVELTHSLPSYTLWI